MSKHLTFLEDFAFKYHPALSALDSTAQQSIKDIAEIIDIERVTEHAIAAAGGLTFIDTAHYDFDDYSDSKTLTVGPQCTAEIHGMAGKIGGIRIVIYNPHKAVGSQVDHMYVPSDFVGSVTTACYGKKSSDRRIRMTYSPERDSYNRMDRFRVADFATQALSRG